MSFSIIVNKKSNKNNNPKPKQPLGQLKDHPILNTCGLWGALKINLSTLLVHLHSFVSISLTNGALKPNIMPTACC
jgi:hypothetical protein